MTVIEMNRQEGFKNFKIEHLSKEFWDDSEKRGVNQQLFWTRVVRRQLEDKRLVFESSPLNWGF